MTGGVGVGFAAPLPFSLPFCVSSFFWLAAENFFANEIKSTAMPPPPKIAIQFVRRHRVDEDIVTRNLDGGIRCGE
jgi:hypothetical protein